MKKIISVFLSLIMVLSTITMLPISAYAWTTGHPNEHPKDDFGFIVEDYNLFEKDGLEYEIIGIKSVRVTGCAHGDNYDPSILKHLIIPEKVNGYTVTEIGACAFEEIDFIESVEIPDSVTYIGSSAFSGCLKLKNIKIGKKIKYFGSFEGTAYSNNKKNWKDGCLYLGTYLLRGSNSSTVKIKNGTTLIASFAFEDCDNVTKIEVPDSVKYICDFAFYNCESLKNVKLSNKIKSIGASVFYASNKVKLNNGYIGKYLFKANTYGTKTFKIKEGTRVVAKDAFYTSNTKKKSNCATKIIIPKSVISIGGFYNSAYNAFYNLKTIEVDKNNKYYSSKKGVLFNKKMTQLVLYPQAKESVSYSVPNTVTSLGTCSFNGNRFLKQLKLNEGLKSILPIALDDTKSIKYLVIPKSVQFIANKSINLTYYQTEDLKSSGIKFAVYPNTAGEKYAQTVYEDNANTGGLVFTYAYVCDKHNYVDKKGKAATYFAYGYTDYQQCKDCGMFKGFKQISKLKLSTPKATIKAGKGSIKVSYKKVKDATGFQLKYTKGKKSVTKTYKTAKSAAKTIKKLKKGSYKVQVRSYIEKNNKKAYSSWSKTKTVKVQ